MPSNLSYANIHLNRMMEAIADCRDGLQRSPGLDGDCAILSDLAINTVREIAAMTEIFSEEKADGINAEMIVEEIGACFFDAADKAEDRRCNPSEPSFAA